MRNILKLELGKYEMETWYFSPFPPEFADCDKLYVCEVCSAEMQALVLQRRYPFVISACRAAFSDLARAAGWAAVARRGPSLLSQRGKRRPPEPQHCGSIQ